MAAFFHETLALPGYRDIMFIDTLCMTHIVPTIRNAAASTV
jgi:hypothetical protein